MRTCINHVSIVTGNDIIENGSLIFEDDVIVGINNQPVSPEFDKTVDGNGLTAVPGYIDTHCHGGNGFDANDATAESIEGIAAFHLRHGVTSIYPTLAADDFASLVKGFEAIRAAMSRNTPGKAEIMGTHLEGPFLNLKHKGSQAAEHFIRFDDNCVRIIDAYKDVIRRITISPEVDDNMQRIALLSQMGIVVSGGHSDATFEQVEEAVAQGMKSVTHLYNAMSQVHKEGPFRICGMTEAGLLLDDLYAEIIADGCHLPAPLMQIAYRCKGADKLLICSDANHAAGGKEGGIYEVCGLTFVVENGVALNSARTSLAGSVTPLDAMVRNIVTQVHVPLQDAVKLASANPARMMGIDQRKGDIALGKDADVNLLDTEFRVVKTFCRGKEIMSEE